MKFGNLSKPVKYALAAALPIAIVFLAFAAIMPSIMGGIREIGAFIIFWGLPGVLGLSAFIFSIVLIISEIAIWIKTSPQERKINKKNIIIGLCILAMVIVLPIRSGIKLYQRQESHTQYEEYLKSPETTEKKIRELAKIESVQKNESLMSLLIRHPSTPADLVYEICIFHAEEYYYSHQTSGAGKPKYYGSKIEACASSKLSADMLLELSKLKDEKIIAGILKNPNITMGVYEKLYSSSFAAPIVARHKNTPVEILRKIHQDYPLATAELSENPNTPPDILRGIYKKGKIAHLVSQNRFIFSGIPREIESYEEEYKDYYRYLESKENGYSYRFPPKELAKNPNTPSDVLQDLHKDCRELIHCEFILLKSIGSNPNTPSDVLRELYEKEYGEYLKSNKSSQDKSDFLSLAETLAKNPNTPVDVLEDLYKRCGKEFYCEKYLLEAIRSNPNTPSDIKAN